MIEFRLPALGADMDEGTLLEWRVKPGEAVKKGQVIAVVDTAKAAIDVEAWQDGVVHRLLVEPGQKMPVGTAMAIFLAPGEMPPPEKGTPVVPTKPPEVGAGGTAPRRRISPAARKRAEELGVSLEEIEGSGPQGAVTIEDVERTAAQRKTPASERSAAMRATIAAAMSRAKREIPHYYLAEDIPLGRLLAWLESRNAGRLLAERWLPATLLIKATALAVRRFPEFNGHFREGRFTPAERIDPGIAIAVKGGLLAPALFSADTKTLDELNRALSDLVARTRTGRLTDAELREATFTISNLGDQGPHRAYAVIVPPQVAIVAFGRIHERPWIEDGRPVAMPLVTATLAADHRVSDGHRGGLFLREIAEILQHPEELEGLEK